MAFKLIALLLLAASSAFGFPNVFCKGHFVSGHLVVGATGGFGLVDPGGGGGGGPGDGYEANLYAYYRMEDADATATGLVDSTSSHRTLTYYAGPNAPITGIIGQGFNLDVLTLRYPTTPGTSTAFVFNGQAFTIRFWIKTSATDGFNDNLVGMSGALPWQLFLGSPPFGGDTLVDFEVTDNSTTYDLMSLTAVGDGAWHRVIAWCDNTGTIGIQIDNNSPATQTGVGSLFNPGSTSMFLGNVGTGSAVDFDELAFWAGYALTSGDRLFDWNSGAGVGWPLP